MNHFDEEKLANKVDMLLPLIESMTYLEWLKFSHAVNRAFEQEETSRRKSVKIHPEDLKKMFKLLY